MGQEMIKILLGLILKADDLTTGWRRIIGASIMALSILMTIAAWINHNFMGADQSSFNEAVGISNKVLFLGAVIFSYGFGNFLGRKKEELKAKL